ncbi:MAG: hypothetical protein ACLTYW_01815 [Collinsella sp.]
MTESCAEFPARHVFIKCPECRRVIDEARLHDNLEVCPRCGKHFRVSGRARMRMTVDEGTFEEWDANLASEDFLSFPGYADKLKSVSERSGERDAVVCGRGKICGCDTALFFMDANFMMGSMGSWWARRSVAHLSVRPSWDCRLSALPFRAVRACKRA